MAKRHVDAFKAKQRKQKIVAAVLSVAFLGVVAFQGPKLWKQLHPTNQNARPSYNDAGAGAATGGTPALVAPSLSGNPAPAGTAQGGSLASAPTPVVADGQLTSFSRFASKDPFAQQLGESPSPTSSSSGSSGGSSSGGSGGASVGKSAGGGNGGASDPTPGTAVISVNGSLYAVAVGNEFPTASDADPSIVPLFHLVSLTAHSAKISIAGGSYANGAPTVLLRENKPITLMNTANGTRYRLILKPVGTAVAPVPSATPSASTTVTVPAPSAP
ncbi:MAG: hypothetical protein ACJ74C_07120 [Gaiellaceae bacterium]